MIALVGPSGVGKTTMLSLLLRFYEPQKGRVLVDGQDAREFQYRSLRRQISIVPQEPVLFSTTVRENIAYGRPEATLDEIVEAAKQAEAHDFIEAMAQGYETPIGERGVLLSGGQRQRLALARAFVKGSPILILDEPTAALDAETEAAVLRALERLRKGRTVFVVAHRLSTVRQADMLLVLHDGQIVERGTHNELVARHGHYARLCELQFGRSNKLCSRRCLRSAELADNNDLRFAESRSYRSADNDQVSEESHRHQQLGGWLSRRRRDAVAESALRRRASGARRRSLLARYPQPAQTRRDANGRGNGRGFSRAVRTIRAWRELGGSLRRQESLRDDRTICLTALCGDCDLLINLCGALKQDELLRRIKRRAYFDLDPGFTQIWAQQWDMDLSKHNLFFTVGLNINGPDFVAPRRDGLEWQTFLAAHRFGVLARPD